MLIIIFELNKRLL